MSGLVLTAPLLTAVLASRKEETILEQAPLGGPPGAAGTSMFGLTLTKTEARSFEELLSEYRGVWVWRTCRFLLSVERDLLTFALLGLGNPNSEGPAAPVGPPSGVWRGRIGQVAAHCIAHLAEVRS